MSTNKRPVAVRATTKQETRKGILYFTLGTQQIDADDNFFIDDTIVKEFYINSPEDRSIFETLIQSGTIIQLEGEVLEDFTTNKFSYIDANNASTNTVRKLKEAESAKAEVERKNAELEARLAAFETAATTKSSKTKGGPNA